MPSIIMNWEQFKAAVEGSRQFAYKISGDKVAIRTSQWGYRGPLTQEMRDFIKEIPNSQLVNIDHWEDDATFFG